MSDIEKSFRGGKAFIGFLTAGDPSMEYTEDLIIAMAESGADLIEIGVPFSDPVAEGPVIQRSSSKALAAGATIDRIFDMTSRLRNKISQPLVLLTYINPIFTYGKEKFAEKCRETGISGVIVPDLPYEEKGEIAQTFENCGLDVISLISPTSGERIEKIAKGTKGFVYCVSSLGVTGERNTIDTDLGAMIDRVKRVKNIPCAVGFGISSPKQARDISKIADGVIVGSAIVKIIETYGYESAPYVARYVREMKDAIS